MKEAELYLVQKLQQQQNSQAQIRKLNAEEQNRTTTIKAQIKDAEAHLQAMEEQKIRK